MNGLGRTSFIPELFRLKSELEDLGLLTMVEVHRNVIASDIGGHCNDRGLIKLPYQMTRRNTVQIRHDDIHQDHVVLRPGIHFVNRFEPIELQLFSIHQFNTTTKTYCTVYGTVERVQELASNPSAGGIVLNKQNLGRSDPARIYLSAFLPYIQPRSSSI